MLFVAIKMEPFLIVESGSKRSSLLLVFLARMLLCWENW